MLLNRQTLLFIFCVFVYSLIIEKSFSSQNKIIGKKNYFHEYNSFNDDGTINVVIEIPAVDNEKWELWNFDLLDIKAQLVVDVKYLKMLKERCEMMDKEWEARQKMRAEEMEACTSCGYMTRNQPASMPG